MPETTRELIEEMKQLHKHLATFTVRSPEAVGAQVLGYLIHIAVRLEALENNTREL